MFLLRLIIIVSLLVLIPTSSFSLKPYLNTSFVKLETGKLTDTDVYQSLLALGLKHKEKHAQVITRKRYQIGEKKWLALTKELAKTDEVFAIELANYYASKGDTQSAKLWLAPHLTPSVPAATANIVRLYANLTVEQEHPQEAFEYLSKHPELRYEQATVLLALEIGNLSFIEQLLASQDSLAKAPYLTGLLADIFYFALPQTITIADRKPQLVVTSDIGSCEKSVTFFATSVQDIQQIRDHLNAIKNHTLLSIVCPSEVRYLPISVLDCLMEPKQAILCNEKIFSHFKQQVKTDYLAVMLPVGGANVHQGILYFDRQDSPQVLIHELAHFVGFVDEYPLRKNHQVCQPTGKAAGQNVIVFEDSYTSLNREQLLAKLPWGAYIKSTTPLWTLKQGRKLLGTPSAYVGEVGLFFSETCINNPTFAYKPILKKSFMRYFEMDIPKLYQALLDNDTNIFFQPSYLSNVNE